MHTKDVRAMFIFTLYIFDMVNDLQKQPVFAQWVTIYYHIKNNVHKHAYIIHYYSSPGAIITRGLTEVYGM